MHIRKKQNSLGFSILEMLIVISILGLVISILLVSTSGGNDSKARSSAIVQQSRLIIKAAREMKNYYGCWPLNIRAMIDPSTYLSAQGNHCQYTSELALNQAWSGPHLNNIPLDGDAANFSALKGQIRGEIIEHTDGGLFLKIGSAVPENDLSENFALEVLRSCSHNRLTLISSPTNPTDLNASESCGIIANQAGDLRQPIIWIGDGQ